MDEEWFNPHTFYGFICKIDPNDHMIKKVDNAGFFRLETMIPEIRMGMSPSEMTDSAVSILGFEVSSDFEKMAVMKKDLIGFMDSYYYKRYFKANPELFTGFFWEVEIDEEEEDSQEEEEEDDSQEEEDDSDTEDEDTEDGDN